jgi:hypothetical protein
MKGRIARLVGDQQLGVIAGDDGVDYLFESASLFRTTFASLHVGAPVTFVPNITTKRASVVRIAIPEVEP